LGNNFASKSTHVAESQTDSAIESGESIKVFGITIEAQNGGTVLFEKYGTADLYEKATMLGMGVMELTVPWLADVGLQVTTPAGITVTVFHSHGGA